MIMSYVAPSNNRGRELDGLYQCLEDHTLWFVTCVHGYDDGSLEIQWNNVYSPTTPSSLRAKIKELCGVSVPQEAFLFCNPCYPAAVRRRYQEELIAANADIIGDWEASTRYDVVTYKELPGGYELTSENQSNGHIVWF